MLCCCCVSEMVRHLWLLVLSCVSLLVEMSIGMYQSWAGSLDGENSSWLLMSCAFCQCMSVLALKQIHTWKVFLHRLETTSLDNLQNMLWDKGTSYRIIQVIALPPVPIPMLFGSGLVHYVQLGHVSYVAHVRYGYVAHVRYGCVTHVRYGYVAH